jgi:hypothetical protein
MEHNMSVNLDFGHLKRLIPEDLPAYKRLESAFGKLRDCMARKKFFEASYAKNAEDLAVCLQEVGAALKAERLELERVPWQWEIIGGSENVARQLVQMGESATADRVQMLLGCLGCSRDEAKWWRVCRHVARFTVAVLGAIRPVEDERFDLLHGQAAAVPSVEPAPRSAAPAGGKPVENSLAPVTPSAPRPESPAADELPPTRDNLPVGNTPTPATAPDVKDYMPAKNCRYGCIKTHKHLKKLLDEETNIRQLRRGQRLLIHAGDWERWKARQDEQEWKTLDRAVPEVERATAEMRNQKAAKKSTGQ